METFKIKSEDEGKVFIVRPLLNAKNLKENILSYKNKIWYQFFSKYSTQTS